MTHRLLLLLLIAGCLLFVSLVFVELRPADVDDEAIAKVAAKPETATAIHRQQSPKPEELVATALARPLFSNTRRPSQNAGGPTTDDDLADARLAGIITSPGHRIAIFAISGDKPLEVAEGDAVSGWRIETITPREVSLTGPTGTKTLQPKLDPNLVPPAGRQLPSGRPPIPAAASGRPPAPPVTAAVAPPPGVSVNSAGALPRPPRVRPQAHMPFGGNPARMPPSPR
jgi:general secretion pathway protein N